MAYKTSITNVAEATIINKIAELCELTGVDTIKDAVEFKVTDGPLNQKRVEEIEGESFEDYQARYNEQEAQYRKENPHKFEIAVGARSMSQPSAAAVEMMAILTNLANEKGVGLFESENPLDQIEEIEIEEDLPSLDITFTNASELLVVLNEAIKREQAKARGTEPEAGLEGRAGERPDNSISL